MAIYGYARISTKQQNLDRQITNIKSIYPDAIIYSEEYTGTKLDRPEWQKLYKRLMEGDTVVFDEVSRMSRSAEDGFKLYKDLYNKQINLVFIKDPSINTEAYKKAMHKAMPELTKTGDEATDNLIEAIFKALNDFMLNKVEQDILSAFSVAQKEVDYLHKRTRDGLKEARKKGKQIGQKKGAKLETKKAKKAKEEMRRVKDYTKIKDSDLMKIVGLSRNTFYKYKRELKEEKNREIELEAESEE